jgi:hypothetical protein
MPPHLAPYYPHRVADGVLLLGADMKKNHQESIYKKSFLKIKMKKLHPKRAEDVIGTGRWRRMRVCVDGPPSVWAAWMLVKPSRAGEDAEDVSVRSSPTKLRVASCVVRDEPMPCPRGRTAGTGCHAVAAVRTGPLCLGCPVQSHPLRRCTTRCHPAVATANGGCTTIYGGKAVRPECSLGVQCHYRRRITEKRTSSGD